MKNREALGVGEMIKMHSNCIVNSLLEKKIGINIVDNSMEFIYETAWKNKVGNVFKTFYTFFIYKKKNIFQISILKIR